MQPDKAPPARPIVTLVCTGKTYLSDGRVGIVFREVPSDGSLGAERIYEQKRLRHARVGAVYEVEVDGANQRSLYTDTLRWLKLWEKQEEAALWQLSAEAFDTQHMAAQQEKKENARKLPLELLAPIRHQYQRTNAASRLAIEVRVLAYLRQISITPDHN